MDSIVLTNALFLFTEIIVTKCVIAAIKIVMWRQAVELSQLLQLLLGVRNFDFIIITYLNNSMILKYKHLITTI